MNTTLNRETAFELEISQDVLAEVHFGGERHCSPEAPCDLAAFHTARVDRILGGSHQAQSTTIVDHLRTTDRVAPRPAAGTRAANQYGTFKVIPASEAQARYVARLLGERDLSALQPLQTKGVEMAREALAKGELSKKLATSVLDYLTQLPVKSDVPVRRASEKQVALITRLLTERDHSLEIADPAALAPREASAAIDTLLAAPKRQAAAPVAELESGIYRVGDAVYKVYTNQTKTRMLAKLLVIDTPWVRAEDGTVEVEGEAHFEYAGMASRFVRADQRMSLEEAKAFGAIYGVCCNCGRTLTDEVSIADGIGPKCKRGLGR